MIMSNLFEKQDSLNNPIECFEFDTGKEIFPVRPHWHYFAEFIYTTKGSVNINCGDKTYTLSEGDFMILHPSTIHSIMCSDKPNPGKMPIYRVLKFDIQKFPANNSYSPSPADIFRYASKENMKVYFKAKEAESLMCKEIFSDCIAEIQHYDYGVDMMLRSSIYKLIYNIIRKWIGDGLNINDCPAIGSSYGIENITEYIDNHLEDRVKITDIAKHCNISYSNFAAKFHERYGMSCKEYIERMRLFKAEEYLLFTDYDLDQISRKTGFTDSSHFIRSFKEYRGTTPKQFRMQKKRTN